MIENLIVYIHGALSSAHSWNFISRSVRQNLGDDLAKEHFFEYDIRKDRAEDLVTSFARKIRTLAYKVKPKKIIFVGHSFGGVLAVAVARENPFNLIGQVVISLASPFGGCEVPFYLRYLHNFSHRSQLYSNICSSDPFMTKFRSEPLLCPLLAFVTYAGEAEWIGEANDSVVTVKSQNHFMGDGLAFHWPIELNHFEILMCDDVVTSICNEARGHFKIARAA